MGIERWGDEEHTDVNSTSANRALIERRLEEQRRFQESLRVEEDRKMEQRDRLNAEREARAMAKPFNASFERGIRSQIMKDDMGREAYKEMSFFSAVTNIVVGTALMVSSVASESLHNKALYDAQDDASRSFFKTESDVKNTLDENRKTTLAMYENAVNDAREELMATQTAYYEEHKQIKETANTEMREARREYSQEQKNLEKESRRADDKYNSTVQDIENKENAARVAYDSEKKEIERKYAGDKDKMSLELKRAQTEHETTMASYQAQRSTAEQQHQTTISDITKRSEMAEQKKNETIARAKEEIAISKAKFDDAVRNNEKVLNNAQTRLDSFNASNSDENLKKSVENYANKHHVVSSDAMFGSMASDFAKAVQEKHQKIGQDIAFSIGSTEEKQILQRVLDQNAANFEAKANGMVAPKIASDDDMKQFSHIVKKYAGDISTEKGVSKTIFQLEDAAKVISGDITALKEIRSKNQVKLDDISFKMQQLTKDMGEITSIQKMLKSGKGADGKTLTAEQRTSLMNKMGQIGNLDGIKSQLASLGKERGLIEKDIKNGTKTLSKKENVLNGITTQVAFLGKHGKAVADTMTSQKIQLRLGDLKGKSFKENAKAVGAYAFKNNRGATVFKNATLEEKTRLVLDGKARKAAKERSQARGKSAKAQRMQKKGSAMVFQSVGRLSRDLSREMHKGNDIHQNITRMAMGASRFASRYEMALNFGKMATKFMMMPMGLMVKFGKHSIHMFGTKTKLGQSISERFGKFKEKHKVLLGRLGKTKTVLGTAGGVFGNKLLRAPIAILRTPMNIMRLPQTLGKKVVDLGFRTTRKGVSLIAGGGAKLTKKGLKALNSKTFGKWKWSKAAGDWFKRKFGWVKKLTAPFDLLNKLKKAIAKLWSKFITWLLGGIIGAITTVAGWIMSLIGYFIWFFAIAAAVVMQIGLLVCVLAVISGWWNRNKTENKALVKNDPSIIINQAINYRNLELEIFELFNKAQTNTYTIPISESPLHYALDCAGYSYGNVSGSVFQSFNQGALNYFNTLENKLDCTFNWALDSTNLFYSTVTNYNSAKVHYYNAGQLETDSSGNYKIVKSGNYQQTKIKQGEIASKYEISNARDALSLVDALYFFKTDKMQKGEVLAYLGVGDYQMATKNASGEKGGEKAYTNLFWSTHHIMYNSGNKASDIWFHPTQYVKEKDNTLTYDVNEWQKYTNTANGNYSTVSLGEHVSCLNKECIERTYTKSNMVKDHTNDIKTYTDTGYGEYDANSAISYTNSSQTLTGTEAFYYSKVNDYDTWLYPDSDIEPEYDRVYYNCQFGSTTDKIYVAQIKTISDNDVLDLHKDSACDKLNFFRFGTNKYYVVNSNGEFMDEFTISTTSNFYKALTKVTAKNSSGNYDVTVNTSYGEIGLKYFYLTWNGSEYEFMHMSHQLIKKPTSALNSAVASGQTLSQVGKVQESMVLYCKKPSFNTSKVSVDSCSHEHDEPITKTVKYYVCQGHIDLDVSIAVSRIEDETIFKDAQKVQGLDQDKEVGSFLGICHNGDDEVWGFGGYTQFAYKPNEDWADENKMDLAKIKVKTDYEYPIDDGQSASDFDIQINRFNDKYFAKNFNSIVENDGKILYGMMFGNDRYYVSSFISGEQKNLHVYKANEDCKITGNSIISFTANNGKAKKQ